MSAVIINVDTSLTNIPTINIGKQGENKATQVVFGVSEMIDTYGSGTAVVVVQRRGDLHPYELDNTSQSGDKVTWTVSNTDTAVYGTGRVQLFWTINDEIAKTVTYAFFVEEALSDPTDAPYVPDGGWISEKIGDLDSLTTTDKDNLVEAINEVDGNTDTNATNITANATAIGTLANLTTTEKSNLVGAINEVDADVSDVKEDLESVTEEDICPNRFNPAEKTDDVILKADGTTTSNTTYATTGFIPVDDITGKTLYFSYGYPTTGVASAAYGYVFYGEDKATVISSSIATWQRTANVPTGAYYLRVSVAKTVMNSYYSVSTDATLKYVAYYPRSIKLVCQDQVDANAEEIEALKNPEFPTYSTAFVNYPMKCGVRTDLYKQCILFGNKDKFAGFGSGNGTLHENSISYSPTDSSTLTGAYLTSYLDCTDSDSAFTVDVGIKLIQSTLGSGATPKIMLIGDSLTAMGVYQKYANDLLSDAGITPTWLGSLTSTYGLHHEGRNGWRAYTYTNCANGSDDISSLSGTNAFLFNGEFNFSSYMSAQGYDGVDIVFINLGTNDFARSNHKEVSEVISYWKTMVDSIRAYDPNIKVVLWICPPPSDRNGINGMSWNARYKAYQVTMSFRGNAWGHDNIYVLPSNLGVDPIYDFPTVEVAPNATSTERIIESSDVTHLSATGFEHLAYPICGMIQHLCSL